MRDVEVFETITAGEYQYRVCGATEIERLHDRGIITRGMKDAAGRLYADWYNSGLGGYGRTSWEKVSSGRTFCSRYEAMDEKKEQAYRDYLQARKAVSNYYQHEISNVILYDLCVANITRLQKGLEQLVKYYKIDT